MEPEYGYIYVRDNLFYQSENVYKVGITRNLYARENTYKTGEVIKGKFIIIIQVPFKLLNNLDNNLKLRLQSYNINKGGGSEFYTRDVIEIIIQYLHDINIPHTIMNNNIDNHSLIDWLKNKYINKSFDDTENLYCEYLSFDYRPKISNKDFFNFLETNFLIYFDKKKNIFWDTHNLMNFLKEKGLNIYN